MTTKKPKLALVGRPNVGKSALFNRICNQRLAIVDEAEGVTRDRLYANGEIFGFHFQVIDTGGIDPRSKALFNDEVKKQAEIAIEEADTIVMVVDNQVGVTDLDLEVARTLLRAKKPLCLAVNKVDHFDMQKEYHDFLSLGISNIVPVSAEHGLQIAELLQTAFQGFDREQESVEENFGIKVAIVGKPNVGKSSLLNFLTEDDRLVVSPHPGTTRDSIDVSIENNGQLYTFVDTAGIRKKHAEHETVDKFASLRTKRAIEYSDICLLVIDAESGFSSQDKKIAKMIEEAGKGCILLINKWDLIKNVQMEHYLRSIRETVSFMEYCPTLFISALSGRNTEKLMPIINQVYDSAHTRIGTHQLNKFIISAMQRNHPPMIQGKRLRIYFMAQVDIAPPKFVLFVNYPDLMTGYYKKYLINQFRKEYVFKGVPIPFYLKRKRKEKKN